MGLTYNLYITHTFNNNNYIYIYIFALKYELVEKISRSSMKSKNKLVIIYPNELK